MIKKNIFMFMLGMGLLGFISPMAAAAEDVSLRDQMLTHPVGEYVAIVKLDQERTLAVRFNWDGEKGKISKSVIAKGDVIRKIYDNLLNSHEGLEESVVKRVNLREGTYVTNIFLIWSWPSARNR